MKTRFLKLLLAASAAAVLAACGGGGDSTPFTPTPTPETPAASKFTQTATWTVSLPAGGGSVCYDFDAKVEVAGCSGTAWDLKLLSGGMTASLFTNGGASGSGSGGAFGSPFVHTWASLLEQKDALIDPASGAAIPATLYAADSAKSVFNGSNAIQSAAFEYDLNGTHQLHPNFKVFLLTTNPATTDTSGVTDPAYAIQLTSYYGGPSGTASGWPTFRWLERSTSTVSTATLDATAGWVYYDLAAKGTTTVAGTWHIAFNRYNVKLNGGTSGSGTMAGYTHSSMQPAGFYNPDGTVITSKFNSLTNEADTVATLTGLPGTVAVPGAVTGLTATSKWIKDTIGSQLNPAYTGTYPAALNYGWFTYFPPGAAATGAGVAGHMIKANPENASLIRSASGNSYARIRVKSITYADPANASSAQTWVIEFGIQPAP